MDKSQRIIAKTDLAEYYDEAGSQTYFSSTQISNNEFLQISNNSNIKTADKPDADGVNTVLGTEHIKVTQKLKFENNHFTITKIDSTYSLEKATN